MGNVHTVGPDEALIISGEFDRYLDQELTLWSANVQADAADLPRKRW